MSANRVEYHQGAIADVKSAVAWYQKRSRKAALDFVEELRRAADTICEAPERWPIGENNTRRFLLWRFPFPSFIPNNRPKSPSGLSLTAADDGNIGRIAFNKSVAN